MYKRQPPTPHPHPKIYADSLHFVTKANKPHRVMYSNIFTLHYYHSKELFNIQLQSSNRMKEMKPKCKEKMFKCSSCMNNMRCNPSLPCKVKKKKLYKKVPLNKPNTYYAWSLEISTVMYSSEKEMSQANSA